MIKVDFPNEKQNICAILLHVFELLRVFNLFKNRFCSILNEKKKIFNKISVYVHVLSSCYFVRVHTRRQTRLYNCANFTWKHRNNFTFSVFIFFLF